MRSYRTSSTTRSCHVLVRISYQTAPAMDQMRADSHVLASSALPRETPASWEIHTLLDYHTRTHTSGATLAFYAPGGCSSSQLQFSSRLDGSRSAKEDASYSSLGRSRTRRHISCKLTTRKRARLRRRNRNLAPNRTTMLQRILFATRASSHGRTSHTL